MESHGFILKKSASHTSTGANLIFLNAIWRKSAEGRRRSKTDEHYSASITDRTLDPIVMPKQGTPWWSLNNSRSLSSLCRSGSSVRKTHPRPTEGRISQGLLGTGQHWPCRSWRRPRRGNAGAAPSSPRGRGFGFGACMRTGRERSPLATVAEGKGVGDRFPDNFDQDVSREPTVAFKCVVSVRKVNIDYGRTSTKVFQSRNTRYLEIYCTIFKIVNLLLLEKQ